MAKKDVSLTLSAEQLEALQSSFRSLTDAKVPTEDQLRTVMTLAVASWIDWFSGRKRYRSLAEQYIDWLSDIFSQVLRDEEPSELRLFLHLHFPYGQAQYLTRVLRDQHQGTWRRKALISLKDVLKDRVEEAKKWVKEGRGEERMSIFISKGSRTELSGVLGMLAQRGGPRLSPIRPEGSMAGYSYMSIAAADIDLILKEIDRSLEA